MTEPTEEQLMSDRWVGHADLKADVENGFMLGYRRALDDALEALQVLSGGPPAEPRWPSGPEAEQELAAALRRTSGSRQWAEKRAKTTLAALQEKRDPGE